MKFVINACYGGFSLSEMAKKALEAKGITVHGDDGYYNVDNASFNIISPDSLAYRAHPYLVETVELLGEEAGGFGTELRVVSADPPTVSDLIESHDGYEKIL